MGETALAPVKRPPCPLSRGYHHADAFMKRILCCATRDSLLTTLFYQGYEADHPNINLLRLRNYTLGKTLVDEEILGSNPLGRVADIVEALVPFVSLQATLFLF